MIIGKDWDSGEEFSKDFLPLQGFTLRVVHLSNPTWFVRWTTWQPGCPVLDINIQGNFCFSQGNGSSDNLPENLV